jgi:glycosyltransferase involved in cell wall biosynthesis
MRDGKIIVARLFSKDEGNVPSRMPVFLGINPEKYEVIFVYNAKDLKKPNIFEQKGKKVLYVSSKKDAPSFSPAIIWKLSRLLKAEKVDIVHCHQHKATVHGILAAKLAGVPVILSHVHGTGRTRNFGRRLVNSIIFRWVSKILTVGEAVKKDVISSNPSVNPEKVISVGNSIDYDKFSKVIKSDIIRTEKFGIKKDALVFGTAGRLAETKGQKFLIYAFAQVKKQIPNSLLLFAGTGELKDELEKQAAQAGLADSVCFLGKIDNMPEFYSAIDVFVLPSIAEGLSRGLMEAMAAGVLCIASNVGGIPEVLNDGRFGYMVAAKDETALAQAMIETAKMPENEKSELVKSAQKNVYDNFRHSVVIKREGKIYDTEVENRISLLRTQK